MNENTDNALISLKNVAISYQKGNWPLNKDKYWVLKNITFNIRKGETLGIIGKNGVGKSTLLRIIAGIIDPEKGELIKNTQKVLLLSLQVGFIQYLTGRENAILSGMLLGLTKNEILERMDNIIQFSELQDYIDQQVKVYSSGMRARLGFSIALQANPDILLLDEILGVGDLSFNKKSTEAMKSRIRSNQTVVLISHSLHTIRELCDRAVLINNGKTLMCGEVEDIISEYVKL